MNETLGALTLPMLKTLKVRTFVALAMAATSGGGVACSQGEANAHLVVGRGYRLTLHLTTRPDLLPKAAAYYSPMVDSVMVMLRVDSASRDSIYATFSGDFHHFPVIFRGMGDSSVVMSEKEGRFRAALCTHSTDAGLELIGTRIQRGWRGKWQTLTPRAVVGEFSLVPGA